MQHYYTYEEDGAIGPLTLDEIRDKHLPPMTPVWHLGLADWKQAIELPELKKSLKPIIPPPFAKPGFEKYKLALETEKPFGGKWWFTVMLLVITSLIIIIMWTILRYNDKGHPKSWNHGKKLMDSLKLTREKKPFLTHADFGRASYF